MPNTLIIVVLDESGSMESKKSDVIGGFNSFISDQKKVKEDQARLYLVKFNTVVTVVHRGVDLESVPSLSDQSYTPGGGTGLYDAIAHSVSLAEKDKTEEEGVVCVIMTDGEENSSRETNKEHVRSLITAKEATGRWTFLYIGEKPDQWAKDYGLVAGQAMEFSHETVGAMTYVSDETIRETIDLFKSRAERNPKINYYFESKVCERSRFDDILINLPGNLRVNLFN